MGEHVCCADLGTTHIKTALIDSEGTLVSVEKREAAPFSTQGGGLVFDADDYFRRVVECIASAVENEPGGSIAGIALTSQRATIVPLDSENRTMGPAISWQDGRGEAAMSRFVEGVGASRFTTITGLPPSALWSLAKVLRLEGAPRIALLHDYVLARLGADELVTDPSNASLTGLLELSTLHWSEEILAAAGLAEDRLPRILPAGVRAGTLEPDIARETGLPGGTPLVVGGGDQQCAALGAGACEPGDSALCVGTAAVISCPTDKPTIDETGRWFCTAHVAPERWVLEGIHNTYGSAVAWACDLLGLEGPEELEGLARESGGDAKGVTFLPFLAGIGSPDFDATASGLLAGLRLPVTRAQVARAVLEGLCHEVRRILESMEPGVDIDRLRVVGGASGSLTNELLSEITGRKLAVSEAPEAGLLGTAILAWTELGRFGSVIEGSEAWAERGSSWLEPRSERSEIETRHQTYCDLVTASRRSVEGA